MYIFISQCIFFFSIYLIHWNDFHTCVISPCSTTAHIYQLWDQTWILPQFGASCVSIIWELRSERWQRVGEASSKRQFYYTWRIILNISVLVSFQLALTLRFCSLLITSLWSCTASLGVRKIQCFSVQPLSATNSGELWRGKIAEDDPARKLKEFLLRLLKAERKEKI